MNEEMKEGADISRLTAGQVARIGRQQSLQLKLSTNPVTVGLKMVRREHCYIKHQVTRSFLELDNLKFLDWKQGLP